jgi:hypothetical protein
MSILPADKSDMAACRRLEAASDLEVVGHLRELLEWLQDMNWPVARLVATRIAGLGLPLTEPLREILRGNDDTWKYYIINNFLPTTGRQVLESLLPDLNRIVMSPTSGEEREELPQSVRDLLQSCASK